MHEYADLEISLHRRGSILEDDTYLVEFRFTQPDSDAEIRVGQSQPLIAKIDRAGLQKSTGPEAYGQQLSQSLFKDPAIRSAFEQALTSSQTLNTPLRVRLLVGATAPELHSLRWETLRQPADNTPLFTSSRVLFYRFLNSIDWRPVRLRSKGELKALAIVANPEDLAEYDLAPIDAAVELDLLKKSLGDIPLTSVPDEGASSRANVKTIVKLLLDQPYDILYLACHGRLVDGESWLWLEGEDGKVEMTPGSELITRLKELAQQPRLVVLASCQSAGDGIGEALTSLGSRLAEAGVPAVLAMQGKVSLDTLSQFMPAFFTELEKEGRIDQAVSIARGTVRENPDHWMPALFMRLKSGRIWYVPGFGDENVSFEKWPALISNIEYSECTPIIGHGLVEPLMGSLREIAQRWAEQYNFPMAHHDQESLPQVAEYLSVHQDPRFPYRGLIESLQAHIRGRYGDEVPEKFQNCRIQLDCLIEAVGELQRQRDPNDPHKVLAQLPLPIYITTNVDNLLAAALKAEGKDPQVVLCPWNEHIIGTQSIYDREKDYYPTPDRPLVYHLFGRLDKPDSVVLTEDNYFDYLIGVTSNKELIPAAVRAALVNSSLLFLGFQVSDWNFRILFRSILSSEGRGRRNRFSHIAAQIQPEEGRLIAPEPARRYLEKYFSQDANINLYWGSVEDFIKELKERMA